jgi:hypothetical protein
LITRERFGLLFLASLLVSCDDRARGSAREFQLSAPNEHQALAGIFVSGDSAALRALLHPDFVVQPPEPDSALQGAAAVDYLVRLAALTSVEDSRFAPMATVSEGPFEFEQGVWYLRTGPRTFRSPYSLRWRNTPEGVKVVLWRWGRFR